jgi:hypothetical protein
MKTLESQHLEMIGHHDLDGSGDGMQIMKLEDVLYVGHLGTSGMATSVLDISDRAKPRLVKQIAAASGSHSHKVQLANEKLLVNEEQFRAGDPYSAGMIVYDLGDPFDPKRIGYFDSTGAGTHRIVWTGGRYAYMSAIPEGFDDRIFVIVDMEDLEKPVEVGRWWWPGTGPGETSDVPVGKRYAAHHALLDGDLGYLGYGDANLVVLDLSDVTQPKVVSKLGWNPGGDTHTCLPLPGRKLVVVTDEATKERCEEEPHLVRIVDIADPEQPRLVSSCPVPSGNYCDRGGRFGPHNLHENREGSYRSESIIFVTYFNAGLRVYDIGDERRPVEIAHWVPQAAPGREATQINDLYVDDEGLIYVTDRVGGGLFVLRPDDELAEKMERARA